MTLDELIKKLDTKYEIVVGFPKEKQIVYPPDDRKGHHNKGGQTVAQVANWNEFGTKNKKGNKHIPSRPFLRTALKKNRSEIMRLVQNAFLPKNINNSNNLDKIGMIMVQMVKSSIRNGNWVPNAEQTKISKLKYKTKKLLLKTDEKSKKIVQEEMNKNKPLIDRGIMLKSVNYEVRKI